MAAEKPEGDDFTTDAESLIHIGDKSVAATLEVLYLRDVLDGLPPEWKTAVDVGAHRGDVTAELLDRGMRVLAVEPQSSLADRLSERFAPAIREHRLHVERCAASDRRGSAELFVGAASTVSSLEQAWMTVAFPEQFQSPRKVQVPLRPVADMLAAWGFREVGFAKIDVEGHELPALRGLLSRRDAAPAAVMFEANHGFPDRAQECLELLRSCGYDAFDLFVRWGTDAIAAERFSGPGLPRAWFACDGRDFYANVIAYHAVGPARPDRLDPVRFVHDYQVLNAQHLLRGALAIESPATGPDEARAERIELRDQLLAGGWGEFLSHPIARHLSPAGGAGAGQGWGITEEQQRAALLRSARGLELLQRIREPRVGGPTPGGRLPSLSPAMLAALYHLTLICEHADGCLPRRVVEVGGGYGASCYAYLLAEPGAAYAIVDVPERLALQHYFLTLALPHVEVHFATSPDQRPEPGRVLLIPASLLGDAGPQADLLYSTCEAAELPWDLRRAVETARGFGAAQSYFAGQWTFEVLDRSCAA